MVPKAGELQFMGSLAGELQPMRPDPIEPSLESSVKNSRHRKFWKFARRLSRVPLLGRCATRAG